MKAKERALNTIIYIFLVSLLIITLVPIIYTIAGSFKPNAEILAHPERMFPSEPTLDNYKAAFTARNFNIPRMFWNSTWYTVLTVVITLTLSTLSGYVFARGGIFPEVSSFLQCFRHPCFLTWEASRFILSSRF